jgi:hypothetical protein
MMNDDLPPELLSQLTRPARGLPARPRGYRSNNYNAKKSHCAQGHELSGDNIKHVGGRRVCRACLRVRTARQKRRARLRKSRLTEVIRP